MGSLLDWFIGDYPATRPSEFCADHPTIAL